MATLRLTERFNHLIKAHAQETRGRLVEAALAALREEGFAGATSRAIARRAGLNQALIFYHYGSLDGDAATLDELLPVMVELYAEDRESGHMRVVAPLVAGSLNRPELGRGILRLMEPWLELGEETLARVLPPGLPVRELAYAAAMFSFGLNLLGHLDPDDTRADAL